MKPMCLTIGGSDSSCASGVQLDVQVISSTGCHPLSVISGITCQNIHEVSTVASLSESLIHSQLDIFLRGNTHVQAIKLGMQTPESVTAILSSGVLANGIPTVCDPVLQSSSGYTFIPVTNLVPVLSHCLLVTPNTEELSQLTGRAVSTLSDMIEAAIFLQKERKLKNVLVKGGHLLSAVDVLVDTDANVLEIQGSFVQLEGPVRGTGCFLSSAIAARLAMGHPLIEAIHLAKASLEAALKAVWWYGGRGVFASF